MHNFLRFSTNYTTANYRAVKLSTYLLWLKRIILSIALIQLFKLQYNCFKGSNPIFIASTGNAMVHEMANTSIHTYIAKRFGSDVLSGFSKVRCESVKSAVQKHKYRSFFISIGGKNTLQKSQDQTWCLCFLRSGAKLYIPSTLNNSNETHTFMCLGRAGRSGQH